MILSPPGMIWAYLLFLLLGLTFGSFGNVIILRLPHSKRLDGRSHCPRCKAELAVLELIPVISFLWLRGRCAHCHKPISLQYPLVEAASALLFLLALHLSSDPVLAAVLALILWLLLLITVIDAHTRMIPDVLNLPLLILCVAQAIFAGHIDILGPLLLGAFFGGQWLVSKGKWVGSGDILLAISIGLLLGGLSRSLFALALAYVIGGIVASIFLLMGIADRRSHIAFAPFLTSATLLTLLFGDALLGAF